MDNSERAVDILCAMDVNKLDCKMILATKTLILLWILLKIFGVKDVLLL